ncbi:hypothetical protein AAXB25_22795 [Paenibacillus lautus]|uniref:hypothetical protein n=1 Tax=Paenibacillus lautus TaxID=1401 RepID=UPI003D2E4584
MPRSVTRWFCEKCNNEYESEQEASKCESQHFDVLKIQEVAYGKGKKCPTRIAIDIAINVDDVKTVYFDLDESVGWGRE